MCDNSGGGEVERWSLSYETSSKNGFENEVSIDVFRVLQDVKHEVCAAYEQAESLNGDHSTPRAVYSSYEHEVARLKDVIAAKNAENGSLEAKLSELEHQYKVYK